jgi:DNA-binding NarL/FixJ family response regulator
VPIRVLVADDHPVVRRGLAALLGTLDDFEVVAEAEDGEAAVARAAEERFDVILMDLRMPRLDGLGALGRLRGNRGPNQATPVVAFTADLTSELAANLCSQGFDGGVAKPLDAAALLQAVASAAQDAPGAADSAAA